MPGEKRVTCNQPGEPCGAMLCHEFMHIGESFRSGGCCLAAGVNTVETLCNVQFNHKRSLQGGNSNVAYCCIAAVLRGEPARQEQLIGRCPEHSIDKIHFIFNSNSIESNSIAVHICMTFATVMQLSEAVLGACTCPSQLPCRTLMVLPTLSSKNHERVQEETVSAPSSSTTLPDESCQCREYLAWHPASQMIQPSLQVFRPRDAQPLGAPNDQLNACACQFDSESHAFRAQLECSRNAIWCSKSPLKCSSDTKANAFRRQFECSRNAFGCFQMTM